VVLVNNTGADVTGFGLGVWKAQVLGR
jgi:hypothetical protein